MELSGTIKAIFEPKDISASFRKRELVLTTDDRYPQQILIEFTQEKIEALDGYSAGDQVKISFNIRGREWTSPRGEVKYFVTIQGWRIETARDNAAPEGGGRGGGRGGRDSRGSSGGGSPDGPSFDDVPFPESPDEGGAPMRDDDIPF